MNARDSKYLSNRYIPHHNPALSSITAEVAAALTEQIFDDLIRSSYEPGEVDAGLGIRLMPDTYYVELAELLVKLILIRPRSGMETLSKILKTAEKSPYLREALINQETAALS